MMQTPTPTPYELRFESLFQTGHGYSFPCDHEGHVDLNGLSDTIRESYLYARAVVGHELTSPVVQPCPLH